MTTTTTTTTLLDLPHDVWLNYIIPLLKRNQVLDLSLVCTFFTKESFMNTIIFPYSVEYKYLTTVKSNTRLKSWKNLSYDFYYQGYHGVSRRLRMAAHKAFNSWLNKDQVEELYKCGIFDERLYKNKLRQIVAIN